MDKISQIHSVPRLDDDFCDVTIRTENGRQFRAHRAVLTEVSDVFDALLRWNNETNDITLKEVKDEMLATLLGM